MPIVSKRLWTQKADIDMSQVWLKQYGFRQQGLDKKNNDI